MREIKFRAWDGEQMISPDYIDREGVAHWQANSIPTVSKILLQFTGLLDKNGVEIYEGDVVEWGTERDFQMTVQFLIEEQRWVPYITESSVVIGNIYENPELLT